MAVYTLSYQLHQLLKQTSNHAYCLQNQAQHCIVVHDNSQAIDSCIGTVMGPASMTVTVLDIVHKSDQGPFNVTKGKLSHSILKALVQLGCCIAANDMDMVWGIGKDTSASGRQQTFKVPLFRLQTTITEERAAFHWLTTNSHI